MSAAARPPDWARSVMRRTLPPEVRESALHDLDEQFALDTAASGRGRALVSYLAEILAPSTWRLRAHCRRERRAAESGGLGWIVLVLLTELQSALRGLRARPGFTTAALSTLAVGMGANIAVFAVFHAVLVAPLPYEGADRIGIVWEDLGDGAQSLPAVSALDYLDYRDWRAGFEDFTLATGREVVVGGIGEPELIDGGDVVAGFFDFFGAGLSHGRFFEEAEDAPGGPRVVVLSHRLWSRRYGSDPEVIGTTIDIDGVAHQVLGVLRPDFRLLLPAEAFRLRDAELWRPLQLDATRQPPRNYTGYTVFGRLAPGVSFAEGQLEMEAFATRLRETHPVHATSNTKLRIVPLHSDVVKESRGSLRMLLAAVGLVLIVACANVAGLFLARGVTRRREIALRAALGAARSRLLLSGLAESAVLAAAGAALGLALASALLRAVISTAAGWMPRLGEARLDGATLLFAAGLTAGIALIFGAVPALHGTARDISAMLRAGGRAGTSGGPRRWMVGAEIAVSVMLLVSAGLLLRGFAALVNTDPGFEASDAVTFRLRLPGSDDYRTWPQQIAFFDTLREQLEEIPGVGVVSGINQLPLTGSGALQPFAYDERTATNWESVTADQRDVLPGLFSALGATLVAGRDFGPEDNRESAPVIVVDESLAALAWPGRDAVGQRLQIGPGSGPDSFAEVVGVVRHMRLNDIRRDTWPQIFFPTRQAGWRTMSFVVRVIGDRPAVVEEIRAVVRRLDPGLPVNELRSLRELVERARDQDRFSLGVTGALALVALALVAVGLYGVVAWTVSAGAREIGIRRALGQTRARARGEVLGAGLRLTGTSAAVGMFGALLVSRTLASLFHGVAPHDPLTYGVVLAIVMLVGLAACWIPGLHATRVDPARCLRTE